MATAWTLHIKGRLFTRITLRDGAGVELARIEMVQTGNPSFPAIPRREGRTDRCRATQPDGTVWWLELAGPDVAVRQGDVEWVRGDAERVRVGDHALRWDVRHDGSRTARVFDAADVPLLRAAAGEGRRAPWLALRLEDDLPHPLPVALAVCGPLLLADIDRYTHSGGGGPTGG